MLFFSKEEFVEKPLKDILDSFQVTTTEPFSPSFSFSIHTSHFWKTRLLCLPLVSYDCKKHKKKKKVASTSLKLQQNWSYPNGL